MVFDVKSNVAVILLFLSISFGVSSYPQPTNSNTKDNKEHDTERHAESGLIVGNIEINKDEVAGSISVPSSAVDRQLIQKKQDQQLSEDEYIDDNGVENGFVTGNIEINKDGIEGNIQLPSDIDQETEEAVQNGNQNVVDIENGQNDALSATMEINDDNIEGHIGIPTDVEDGDFQGEQSKALENGVITGNLAINDENIEGSIELPTDDDQGHPKSENDYNKQPDVNFVMGSIEINDKNIEGHIDIPSDVGDPPTDSKLGDGEKYANDNEGDVLSGSVEIGDDYIEGHIDIPDIDGSEVNPLGEDGKSGVVSGTVEINDYGIEGHIDIPSDDDQIISNDENDNNDDLPMENDSQDVKKPSKDHRNTKKSCWMTLNAKHHIDALDKLDTTYNSARQKYQKGVGKEFDKKMMEVLLRSQGAAPRAIHQAEGDPSQIPAGMNLGGTCMMRMQGSILFFHRMKLRNSTQFTVNFLNTDLVNMLQVVRLSLNDLHLKGAYERLTTDRDPSMLFYVPNIGEIEVLLKNVVYKMEGHLRMLNNRLIIEHVNSDVLTNDIILTYVNSNDSSSIKLQPRNIEDFLERLKADLDFWLKDYFNDYLMYFGIVGNGANVLEYEKKKTISTNNYADDAVKSIKQRILDLGLANVKLPHFTIFSVMNSEMKLMDGVLRGLDSLYRRSVATTKKSREIRQLDFIIGFSQLKIEYKYEALISTNTPPLSGKLILSADEITAHLEMAQIAEPETIDLLLDTIMQIKPDSLTVEGPANRLIANFKALLEHPIVAIMSNTLKHNIKMMKSLTRCDPYIYGKEKRKPYVPPSSQSDSISVETDNEIDDYEESSPDDTAGNSDLDESVGNSKDGSDYVFSKNDSIEIEVPVNGHKKTYKLHRNEKLVLTPDNTAGNSELNTEDDDESENDKDWSDYVFSKNDSMEIEVPVKGDKQQFKLARNEKLVLSKVDA